MNCSILLLLQNNCTALDANLVRIETGGENNFLRAEIQKLHPGKKAYNAHPIHHFMIHGNVPSEPQIIDNIHVTRFSSF